MDADDRFGDFDGRVFSLDEPRVMEQTKAGARNVTTPQVQTQTSRPELTGTSCPPRTALAAYRDLVQLGGVRHRGWWLPAKQRDRIRRHLRICLRCQTELVASRKNDHHSVRSTVVPLRLMQLAAMVAILASIAWLTEGPRRLVGHAEAILRATEGPRRLVGHAEAILRAAVSQARDTAAPRSPTPIDAVSSGIVTTVQPSEAPQPPTAQFSSAQTSQPAGQDQGQATGVASNSQAPNSRPKDKQVADLSPSQNFSLGKGTEATAKNHHWTGDRSVRGQRAKPAKRRTPYHLESDRLYTMDEAKSLILRFRSLGYTADATPVQSGAETVYQIEVGSFKTAREANDAADDLESGYDSGLNSP